MLNLDNEKVFKIELALRRIRSISILMTNIDGTAPLTYLDLAEIQLHMGLLLLEIVESILEMLTWGIMEVSGSQAKTSLGVQGTDRLGVAQLAREHNAQRTTLIPR
jgi:hypothetical protein